MNPYVINPFAAARRMAEQVSEDQRKKKDPEQDQDVNGNGKKSESDGKRDPLNKSVDPLNAKDPQDPKAPSVLMDEVSWSEQDVLQSYLPFGNNPDPIVRSKGLKIYKEMMQDEQIKVCMDVRIQARLSTPWEIVAGQSGNAKSEEMADFVKECLTRMGGTFENDMEQLFSAITYGFSLGEKIFDYIDQGRFKGKIGLKSIKVREPFNYDFKIDAHGNLLGIVYVGMTGTEVDQSRKAPNLLDGMRNPIVREGASAPYGRLNSLGSLIPGINTQNTNAGRVPLGSLENPFPPEKFIVYSYNPQFGNWYGRSDLLGAFPWWLMKKHGRRFWAIWLERYASPFLIAMYKRDSGLKPAALNAVDDFIRNMQTRNGIRLSDAWSFTPIQFNSGTGRDAYEVSTEAFNRYIAHSLLMPNLLGFTGSAGSSGGSYSLGQKQFDSFLWVLNKMGRDMSSTVVGEQIIKPLITINFGDDVEQELMPKFRFVSIEDASIDVRSQIIQRLGQAGFVSNEEDWVRDFLTLPKKDPNIVLVKPVNPFDKGQGDEQGGGRFPDKNGKKDPANLSKPGEDPDKKSAPKSEEKDESKMSKRFKERAPDEFEKKVRVKQFQDKLARMDEGLFNDASAAIEGMRDELLDKIQRKKLVANADPREVSKLMVNGKALNDALSKWTVKVFLDSKLGALEEMGRAGLEVDIVKKFAVIENDWEPLPPADALDFFRRKVIAKVILADGTKKVIDFITGSDITFLKNRAFTVTGIVRDDILNDAKQVILNGIKRGDETGTVKDLKDMFNRYLDQGIAVDGEILSPNRLNTIVRTNITEALNEGRASMISDPDIGDFVQFFEYSAIMDERTTDYCSCMDGKIFRVEDLPTLKPPAHFNCRSIIIPITRFEVDQRKQSGEGIEISRPCPDRMSGFNDLKRATIEVIQGEALRGLEGQEISREELLKRQLGQIIVRCPYKMCGSDKIEFRRALFNVGEFGCQKCEREFRISNAGDIYLRDYGIEKWERVSEGLVPHYFQEDVSGITVCPYKICRGSDVRFDKREKGISHYSCGSCGLPFRCSDAGELYLYDAGQEEWQKVRNSI